MTSSIAIQEPVISMSQLGRYGRFGNQFFQYAFLKAYAQEHGCRLELPADWIGRRLFQVDAPEISRSLDPILTRDWIQEGCPSLAQHDVLGYFQHPTGHYAHQKDLIRRIFQPQPKIETVLQHHFGKIRSRGKTVVGLHLRRGDFGYGVFWIAPARWYLEWLEQVWKDLEDPVLLIISDEPARVIPDFAKYQPMTFQSAQRVIPGAEFYPDFWAMTQCDLLAISNSTYSFAASMLNSKASCFMRPDAFGKKMIAYDPWNSATTLDGPADALLLEKNEVR